MQNKTKRFILSIVTFVIIAITLATVIISSSLVFADDKKELVGNKAQQIVRDLARTEAKIAYLTKCVPDGIDTAKMSEKVDYIFRINTWTQSGAWLEKEITGTYGDGMVNCDEGDNDVLKYYGNMFGVGLTGIVCNMNNTEYPGLGIRTNDNTKASQYYITGCQNYANGKDYGRYFDKNMAGFTGDLYFYPDSPNSSQIYENGEEYIIELYSHWKRENKEAFASYLPNWGNLSKGQDIKPFVKYYVARNDFITMCGEKEVPASFSGTSGVYLQKIVSNNGIVKDTYFEAPTDKSEQTLWGEQGANCENLSNRVNETYEAWREKMKEIYENECNNNQDVKEAWNFERRRANYIINGDPEEAVIITPEYEATPDTLIWYSDSNPAGYDKTKYNNWEKNGLVWKNYSESKDEDGNTIYTTIELTEDDKASARTLLGEYNKYKDEGFFEENESTGEFICHVPEGYEYTEAEPSGQGSSGDTDPCYEAGVESMSWILCPTINNAATTIDGFESALKTMLSIESNKLFGSDTESYKIWETFRNIANVILIIIFLAIIFSQLTGYGIDNYGIKKMLPKLIVMAILINLSYILCEIAVDLSNILGVGLNNLFEGMAGDAASQNSTYQIVTALLAAAAGITAGVAIVFQLISEGGGAMVVVTLVLAVLAALVVIFMFLAMVGLRMIIVVVFTVISPVAFALYILPNTQSLFKRWWKVFEAALVVYPICGALYGAHFIIKAIILGQTGEGGINFFMGIAAVIAPFLPFVALPSLLKGALAGLGVVAGAVTAIGSGLKKGVNKTESAIKGSQAYKNAQQNAQEKRAQNTYSKLKDKLAKGEDLTASQRRRYLRAGAITQKAEKDAESVYKGNFDTQDRSKVTEALKESLLGNDAQKAGAAFDSLLAQGGIDEALGALEGADWGAMQSEVRDRLLRGMSGSNVDAMRGFAKYRGSGGTAGFSNWVNNTRTDKEKEDDKDAKVQSYAQHLRENGEHAMDGYSKDEAQFIASHMGGIWNGEGALSQKEFGSMLGSAGLNSKDAKAQTTWDNLIAGELRKSNINASDLGLTADSIGTMREGMSHKIREGVGYARSAAEGRVLSDNEITNQIQQELANQISAAQASSIIKDRAKAGVLKDFGIT